MGFLGLGKALPPVAFPASAVAFLELLEGYDYFKKESLKKYVEYDNAIKETGLQQ